MRNIATWLVGASLIASISSIIVLVAVKGCADEVTTESVLGQMEVSEAGTQKGECIIVLDEMLAFK